MFKMNHHIVPEDLKMLYQVVQRVKRRLPSPVLERLRAWGLSRFLGRLYRDDEVELAYQRAFAQALQQNPHWEEGLSTYWHQHRCLEALRKLTPVDESSRVLDVGCGLTSVLRLLPGERVGLDPLADEYTRLLPYPPGVKLVRGSGEQLPFEASSFDLVCCSNALDHMRSPQQVVAELARVLRPGGWLWLTVEIFEAEHLRGPAHPHALTQEQVLALLHGTFEPKLMEVRPWLGLRQYLVEGVRVGARRELIIGALKPGAP